MSLHTTSAPAHTREGSSCCLQLQMNVCASVCVSACVCVRASVCVKCINVCLKTPIYHSNSWFTLQLSKQLFGREDSSPCALARFSWLWSSRPDPPLLSPQSACSNGPIVDETYDVPETTLRTTCGTPPTYPHHSGQTTMIVLISRFLSMHVRGPHPVRAR